MPKRQKKPKNFVPDLTPEEKSPTPPVSPVSTAEAVGGAFDPCLLEKRMRAMILNMPVWKPSLTRENTLDCWTEGDEECVRFTAVFERAGWEYSWVVRLNSQFVATATENSILTVINDASKSALHHISRLSGADADQL